jgi:LPXTG-site transpeptidase (sortase) family protein
MTTSQHDRRRHRHRTPPLRRLVRAVDEGRGHARAAVLAWVAVLILGIGALVAIGGGTPSDAVAIVTASVSPSPSAGLSGGPTLPVIPTPGALVTPSPRPVGIVARRIRIPRLEIDLRIIEGDGVDAPMGKAAHYPGTGWPDSGSNVYIYAHAQTGMFLTLWDAKVGDEIFLDLADDTTRRFVVTDVRPRVKWNAMEYLDPTPTEQLTLQTSTSYTATAPRFIVIAVPAA